MMFEQLLEKVKISLGIGGTICADIVDIMELSGLTANPSVVDVTDGTRPTSIDFLKEHYYLSTKSQIKMATTAVATYCGMTLMDVKQTICEFSRHNLSMSALENGKKHADHQHHDIIFDNMWLYKHYGQDVWSLSITRLYHKKRIAVWCQSNQVQNA